jgi:predicted GIY-YIG superfamily endonuclease
MYYVYILKCNNNKSYTGYTKELKERIARHKKGYVPATVGRLPVKLVSYIAFSNKHKAFEFEKYLKTGFRQSFHQKTFLEEGWD